MSETNTSSPVQKSGYTLIFMTILSFICAIILSTLAAALKEPQEQAKDLDRSKEMLIAARILSPYGYFQVKKEDGAYVPAKAEKNGILVPADQQQFPGREEILNVYKQRIAPFLVNDKGEEKTFAEEKINEDSYLRDYKKTGYYKQPLKLVYKIFSNEEKDKKVEGYVFPVNGMGLWDAIYGYLAIETDADTVIGISWYDQKETPGLGANISEPEWQSQFPNKKIFQESPNGTTDFQTAPLGITVVKGKVNEVIGNSPKALSAVDGMAGATLTGNGVQNAYRDVLAAYRPFLLLVHEKNANHQTKEAK